MKEFQYHITVFYIIYLYMFFINLPVGKIDHAYAVY